MDPLFPVPPPPFGDGPGCQLGNNLAAGAGMAQLLRAARAASSPLQEALRFRYWLSGFCEGGCAVLGASCGQLHVRAGRRRVWGEHWGPARARAPCLPGSAARRPRPPHCRAPHTCPRNPAPRARPRSYNPLFSGDGYTFTGTGGTLAPLGREMVVGPFEVTWRPNEIVSIPVCISARNGGRPNAAGVCSLT